MKHLPIIFLLLLAGCISKQKALNKLEKDLPKICADRFPVKDSTIYIKGDTINTVEFFEGESDTIYTDKIDTVVVTVTKNVVKNTTKLVRDTIKLVRENTARVAQLQGENATLQDKLNDSIAYGAKWHGRAGDYLFWLIALIVGNLLFVAIKLFRK